MSSLQMGVVHKLKQEVIDFILAEKKTNPQISCRRLAEVIQEKFQLEVSKSSVNSVLKNAQLSSAVGRRLGTTKLPKKFTIPVEKKKQISDNVQQFNSFREQAKKEVQEPSAVVESPPQNVPIQTVSSVVNPAQGSVVETKAIPPQEVREEKIDDQKIIQKEKEIEEEIKEKAEEMGFTEQDESEAATSETSTSEEEY